MNHEPRSSRRKKAPFNLGFRISDFSNGASLRWLRPHHSMTPSLRYSRSLALVLILGAAASTRAATNFWTGGASTGDWTSAANWSNNVPPVAGADLVFQSGASRTTNTNNFSAGTGFHSITFSASGYTNFGNALRLTNGIQVLQLSGSTVFNPAITNAADQTFAVSSGLASLTLNGDLAV